MTVVGLAIDIAGAAVLMIEGSQLHREHGRCDCIYEVTRKLFRELTVVLDVRLEPQHCDVVNHDSGCRLAFELTL